MHACRTSKAILNMTDDFSKLCESLDDLMKSLESKGILVKMTTDVESNIIRIRGENSDGLTLAKVGLEEIEELALTTAEHHPYWGILYNGTQILKIVLEKWNDVLSIDELKEISWHTDEIKNSSKNTSLHHHGK